MTKLKTKEKSNSKTLIQILEMLTALLTIELTKWYLSFFEIQVWKGTFGQKMGTFIEQNQ